MRKLTLTAVGLIILCGAFLLMWSQKAITEMIFLEWMGGILTLLGIYTGGNIRAKKWYVEGEKAKGSQDGN